MLHTELFFLGGVTATAPSRDLTDNKKKGREGSSRGESKRKLPKETQNQRKETRKKKKKFNFDSSCWSAQVSNVFNGLQSSAMFK